MKHISMMKLGIPLAPQPKDQQSQVAVSVEKVDESENRSDVSSTNPVRMLYADWGYVIEKISNIKKSLSAGIASATVYKCGGNEFVIRLNDFFAKKLADNETDFAIVRGVIAEAEGKIPAEINVKIEVASKQMSNAFSEIEKALK